jgi:hypothetical protein
MNTWEPTITYGLALAVKVDTSCFRSNQYAYRFSFTCGSWFGPFLLFWLPHWWSQWRLKQHKQIVPLQLRFCIVFENLMYLPMYTWTSTALYFSSDQHHFNASSPIVFTTASSVSRTKFATQATIVLLTARRRETRPASHQTPPIPTIPTHENRCSDRHCRSSFPLNHPPLTHHNPNSTTSSNKSPHDSPKTHHQSD